MSRYQTILVAVDGSKNAEKAFVEAIELSKEHDAHLYIAYVVNEIEITYSAYAYSKLLAEEQAHVEKVLLEKVEYAKQQGIQKVQSITQIGHVKTVLTETIPEKYPLDLLVVGATGKGAIQRASVGSTASYVVNHAPCSVLVVK
ncbi:hypothetical protein IGI37_000575 [Enterococcus sp. AZ194]|uniref:universal stress protein n=1 Tax=Enterococcus sp. AZ194 TaxID=2774629 RepID=UPI003F21B73E